MHIISEDLQDILWKKLYDECKLVLRSGRPRKWIRVPGKSSIYHKDSPWTEEQENLINSFLEELVDDEIYALDWQHDCFLFSPQEHIPFMYEYYDSDRDVQVYFPTYYPDGDYHFVFDKEWKYGIFGHPWKQEIVVMGRELIEKFEDRKADLGLV